MSTLNIVFEQFNTYKEYGRTHYKYSNLKILYLNEFGLSILIISVFARITGKNSL